MELELGLEFQMQLKSGKSDAFDLHTKQITQFNGYPQLKRRVYCVCVCVGLCFRRPNLSPIYLGIQRVIKYLWPGRVFGIF